MVALGLSIVFFTGFSCVLWLNRNNTLCWQEIIGLSFPGGIAQIVFSMLVLDWANIPLTCISVSLAAIFLILLWASLFFACHQSLPPLSLKRPRLYCLNLVWCVFFGFVAYLAYINFQNTLFYPFCLPEDIDSINGYETIGYMVSREHTLRGLAIFRPEESPLMRVPTSYIGYAPLTQLSFAYIHLFNPETAKSIPAFMFVSFLLAFYGLIKRNSNNLSAILATFFTMLTPYLLKISFGSMTNAPHIIYASFGTLYGIDYVFQCRKGIRNTCLLWLSAWFLSASCLTRSDGIVLPCALCVVLLYESFRMRIPGKDFLLWTASIIGVLIFWALYRFTGNMATENFFIKRLFIDIPRAQTILKDSFLFLFQSKYYGWTFYVFTTVFVLELFFVFKRKASLLNFLVPAMALSLYFILLYHMDHSVWAPLWAILSYSATRFYICLVPLAWFAVFCSFSIRTLLEKLQKKLSFQKCRCLLPLLFFTSWLVSCKTPKQERKDCFYTADDLKIGDFFYQDGTWSDGGLRVVHADGTFEMAAELPQPAEGKQVIGIVFQTDTNRIGIAEKEALRKAGVAQPHGLAMSVKKANNGKACAWGPWNTNEQSKAIRKKDCFQAISGLGNYERIRIKRFDHGLNKEAYPAFTLARIFQAIDSLDAPQNTSGWILPSAGQWWDIWQNLGGVSILRQPEEQNSRASNAFFWYGQKGICDKLNAWMQKIAPADKHLFTTPFDLYWTSSEYDKRDARYVAMINDYGYLYMQCTSKTAYHYVRCILAF